MAARFTYSGDPRTSDKDAVRFLVPDVNREEFFLSDDEILYLLETFGGTILSAAEGCEQIAGEFARRVNKKIGRVSLDLGSRAQAFRDRAKALRETACQDGAEFFFGGLSISGKQTLSQDTDAIQPMFIRGQDDNLRNPQNDSRTRSFWDWC